jgi:hypothetical protein
MMMDITADEQLVRDGKVPRAPSADTFLGRDGKVPRASSADATQMQVSPGSLLFKPLDSAVAFTQKTPTDELHRRGASLRKPPFQAISTGLESPSFALLDRPYPPINVEVPAGIQHSVQQMQEDVEKLKETAEQQKQQEMDKIRAQVEENKVRLDAHDAAAVTAELNTTKPLNLPGGEPLGFSENLDIELDEGVVADETTTRVPSGDLNLPAQLSPNPEQNGIGGTKATSVPGEKGGDVAAKVAVKRAEDQKKEKEKKVDDKENGLLDSVVNLGGGGGGGGTDPPNVGGGGVGSLQGSASTIIHQYFTLGAPYAPQMPPTSQIQPTPTPAANSLPLDTSLDAPLDEPPPKEKKKEKPPQKEEKDEKIDFIPDNRQEKKKEKPANTEDEIEPMLDIEEEKKLEKPEEAKFDKIKEDASAAAPKTPPTRDDGKPIAKARAKPVLMQTEVEDAMDGVQKQEPPKPSKKTARDDDDDDKTAAEDKDAMRKLPQKPTGTKARRPNDGNVPFNPQVDTIEEKNKALAALKKETEAKLVQQTQQTERLKESVEKFREDAASNEKKEAERRIAELRNDVSRLTQISAGQADNKNYARPPTSNSAPFQGPKAKEEAKLGEAKLSSSRATTKKKPSRLLGLKKKFTKSTAKTPTKKAAAKTPSKKVDTKPKKPAESSKKIDLKKKKSPSRVAAIKKAFQDGALRQHTE